MNTYLKHLTKRLDSYTIFKTIMLTAIFTVFIIALFVDNKSIPAKIMGFLMIILIIPYIFSFSMDMDNNK